MTQKYQAEAIGNTVIVTLLGHTAKIDQMVFGDCLEKWEYITEVNSGDRDRELDQYSDIILSADDFADNDAIEYGKLV